MSEQILSIEQMQHLKELGVDTSKASMCWIIDEEGNDDPFISLASNASDYVCFSTYALYAFTLQDILDLLPKDISKEGCTWSASLYVDYENNRIVYGNTDRYGFEIYHEEPISESIIDTAYEMLCWCAENGYVETKKKRL